MFFFFLFLAACQEKLIQDLSEVDANKLIILLSKHQIEGKKSVIDDQWSVSVAKKDLLQAMSIIDAEKFYQKKSGQELKSSYFNNAQQREIIYERYKADSLERSLKSIAGVIDVHVHFQLSGKDQSLQLKPERNRNDPSASILMSVNYDFNLSEFEIINLISGATGLSSEQIYVVIKYPNFENAFAKSPQQVQVNTDNQQGVGLFYFCSALALISGCYLVNEIWKRNQLKKQFKATTNVEC